MYLTLQIQSSTKSPEQNLQVLVGVGGTPDLSDSEFNQITGTKYTGIRMMDYRAALCR